MVMPVRNSYQRQFRYKGFLLSAIWSFLLLFLDIHTIGAMTSRVKIRELSLEKLSCYDGNGFITIKPQDMLVKSRDIGVKVYLINCNHVVYKRILKSCLLQRRCSILLYEGELSTCNATAGNRATQVEVGYDCVPSGVTSFCGEGVNFQKNGGYLKSPDPIDARIRQCTCSFSGLSPGSASVHLNLVYQDYDTKEQNIEVFYNNDGNPVAWSNAEYTPSLVMYGDFHVKFTNDQKSSGGNVILRYTGTGHVFNIRCETLYEEAGVTNGTLIAVIALVVVLVAVVMFIVVMLIRRKGLKKRKQGRGGVQDNRPVVSLNQIRHTDSEDQASEGHNNADHTDGGGDRAAPNDSSNQATEEAYYSHLRSTGPEHVYDSARHTEEKDDDCDKAAGVSYYSHLGSRDEDHEYDSLGPRPVDINKQNPSSDVTGAHVFDVNDMYEATGDESDHSPRNSVPTPDKTVLTVPRYDLEDNDTYTSPDEPVNSEVSSHNQTNAVPISETSNIQMVEENDTYQAANTGELEENDTYTSHDEPINSSAASHDQIQENQNIVHSSTPVMEENDTYIID